MAKFKPTIKGAMEYYDSIELYEDRLKLREEFEKETGKSSMMETELYKYIRDYKLKNSKKN